MATKFLSVLRKRRIPRFVLLVSLPVALLGSSFALAQQAEPEAVGDEATTDQDSLEPPPPVEYRPDDDVIVFSLPDEEGEFVDCSEAVVTGEGDGLMIDVEGCFAAGTLGPNGQSNHGQVVRAFVHELKSLEYEGPRGHLVRNVAMSDFGKKENGGEAVDTEAAVESDQKARGRNKTKSNRGKP